jgi:selenocysteine lyase/cysteine desulfurase
MAYGCAIALARSMEFINSIGVDRVFAHNRDLADHLSEGLRSQGATIISDPDKGYQSSIVSAALSGMDSSKAIKQLEEAGVYVSSRADSIRFSPHLYNYRGDIDNVLDHMKRIFGKNN